MSALRRAKFMHKIFLLIFCGWLCLSQSQAQIDLQKAAAEVADAERAFAESAARQNAKAAFLEFGADDAVIFNQQPENSRDYWMKRAAVDYLLKWKPSLIIVAASGNLALSTGTSIFALNKQTAPVAGGEFATIWRRQPNGKWRFTLDIGVDHKIVDLPNRPQTSKPAKTRINAAADQWRDVEQTFYEVLRANRIYGTYEKLAADNIRLVRDGNLPFDDKKSALKFFDKRSITLRNRLIGGAADADFIYTYGEYSLAADGTSEKGFFLRVWRFDGKTWRIAFDLARPIKN